jgi:hypothetical protein
MTYFETCTFVNPHGDELNHEGDMFGVGVFFEKFFQTFVTRELSLFKRLYFQLMWKSFYWVTTTKGNFRMWHF